jgi:adenosylcobyric acid synthase
VTKSIFIGGTSSHAGKSWMATAICAWLRSRGIRVAPFKAQNMSNNSYPCRSGGEIGRAQVAQAWACGLEPEPDMNPILLKPQSNSRSQIIINGKLWATLSAREYYAHHHELFAIVTSAYEGLASNYDVIVIEGAGSVTELNLRQYDLANLRLVTHFGIPWLLVSDIERGGVFASIVGTGTLLTHEERALWRAFAVNKFRGDISLFDEGRRILEEHVGRPCLGVFPFSPEIHLDDEDSLSLPPLDTASAAPKGQRCAIIRFPSISNTTDFRALADPAWIDAPSSEEFDFIFLPGTKNTALDLEWLKQRRLDDWIRAQHRRGATVIGICGGFQMLGREVSDPYGMESSSARVEGLGLLPVTTMLNGDKTTRTVTARSPTGNVYSAYEIHLGDTRALDTNDQPFAILDDGSADGMRGDRIIGTYLHGAFEHQAVLSELGITASPPLQDTFRQLADWFEPFGERFEELFT